MIDLIWLMLSRGKKWCFGCRCSNEVDIKSTCFSYDWLVFFLATFLLWCFWVFLLFCV